jgi:hypothetical protein
MAATSSNGAQRTRAASALLEALERCWMRVRALHPQVPEVVLIVASSAGARGVSEKWGHFAPCRWQHQDEERHEVMIGGEGLKRGAAGVLETVLHEAAHGLAAARQAADTSRQGRYHNRRFKQIAAELGLQVEEMHPHGWARTELGEEARRLYVRQLRELERALVLWRRDEPERERGKGTSRLKLWQCGCEPPRKIRIAAGTAEQGPIMCGICGEEFEGDEEEESDG